MVARDLLRELEGRGVRLAVQEGELIACAPQGAVTPELAERIKMRIDGRGRWSAGSPAGTVGSAGAGGRGG